MKNAVTLALAAALSTASLGGIAFAQTTTGSTSATTMSDDVRIVRIDENSDSDDANNPIPEMFRNPTADMTADAKAQVQADAEIMAELQENTIDLDNVLAAADAAGLKLPVAQLLTDAYRAMLPELGGADQSAALLALERANPGIRLGEGPDRLPT